MKKLICLLSLLPLVMITSTVFAAIGDTYDPYADFSWDDPYPWQYLCQEGTGVWDGTYNFTPMVVRILGTTGNPMWGAPNATDFYGWQCGLYQYYGNIGVNSYKMLTDPSHVYGVGILAFTAPESGDYNFKGWVSGVAGNSGIAWINTPGLGQLWSAPVIGDWTQSLPQFDFTVNLAAGNSVYFGSTIITGTNIYGLFETFPIYWKFTVTQTSEGVVPEPGNILTLAGGLFGMTGLLIRRKR